MPLVLQTLFVHSGVLWHRAMHVLAGAFCGITLLFAIFFTENKLLEFVKQELSKRYSKKTE